MFALEDMNLESKSPSLTTSDLAFFNYMISSVACLNCFSEPMLKNLFIFHTRLRGDINLDEQISTVSSKDLAKLNPDML